jgi:hypothetical protein
MGLGLVYQRRVISKTFGTVFSPLSHGKNTVPSFLVFGNILVTNKTKSGACIKEGFK